MMGILRPTDLAIVETHPVQYHAPVYRCLQQRFGIRTTAIYGSDFSVTGAVDREFGRILAWDSDLLSGYQSLFLSHVATGGTVPAKPSIPIANALEEARPKAILLPGYSPAFYRRALLFALRTGAPILFRGETTDHARKRNPAMTLLRDGLLRYFYRRCGALLYVGVRSREHFRRFESPDSARLFYSPSCADTASARPDEAARESLRQSERKRLRLTEGQIALLFSGTLTLCKGPDLLLAAARQLPPGLRHRVVVIFTGSGEMEGILREFAEKAGVQVRFAGFQNPSRLSPYYHAADLLVLPSRYSETWGVAVNEALHHGLPCVVSDAVGCLPDLIVEGETGASGVSCSIPALADAIHRAIPLIRRPEIRTLCRERVQRYSIENAAEGIARAFHFVSSGLTK